MTIATAIAATSPDLWWKCDETSGTTAHDSSGHGRNGGISGDITLGVTGPELGTTAFEVFATGLINGPTMGLTSWPDFTIGGYFSYPGQGAASTEYDTWNLGVGGSPTVRGPSVGLINNGGTPAVTFHFPTASSTVPQNLPAPAAFWHWVAMRYTTSSGVWSVWTDTSQRSSGTFVPGRTNPQTTDILQCVGGTPVVLAHLCWWGRRLSDAELTSIGSFFSVWPYNLPVDQPVSVSGGPVDLTPVLTAISNVQSTVDTINTTTTEIDTDEDEVLSGIASIQSSIGGGITVDLTPVLTAIANVLAQVQVTIPTLSGASVVGVGDALMGSFVQSLTSIELTSGPTSGNFTVTPFLTFFALKIDVVTIPSWVGQYPSGVPWYEPDLWRMAVSRGGSIAYSAVGTRESTLLPPPFTGPFFMWPETFDLVFDVLVGAEIQVYQLVLP